MQCPPVYISFHSIHLQYLYLVYVYCIIHFLFFTICLLSNVFPTIQFYSLFLILYQLPNTWFHLCNRLADACKKLAETVVLMTGFTRLLEYTKNMDLQDEQGLGQLGSILRAIHRLLQHPHDQVRLFPPCVVNKDHHHTELPSLVSREQIQFWQCYYHAVVASIASNHAGFILSLWHIAACFWYQ